MNPLLCFEILAVAESGKTYSLGFSEVARISPNSLTLRSKVTRLREGFVLVGCRVIQPNGAILCECIPIDKLNCSGYKSNEPPNELKAEDDLSLEYTITSKDPRDWTDWIGWTDKLSKQKGEHIA